MTLVTSIAPMQWAEWKLKKCGESSTSSLEELLSELTDQSKFLGKSCFHKLSQQSNFISLFMDYTCLASWKIPQIVKFYKTMKHISNFREVAKLWGHLLKSLKSLWRSWRAHMVWVEHNSGWFFGLSIHNWNDSCYVDNANDLFSHWMKIIFQTDRTPDLLKVKLLAFPL